MHKIIAGAQLPIDRVILDALGWASDPQALAALGWPGSIGYHFYPWWLPTSATRADYAALFRTQLAGISNRTYVTEFGATLNVANLDYEQPAAGSSDVACLQGMQDAIDALKLSGPGILGAFHWHGWPNGDSFSLPEPANRNGSAKVLKILRQCCGCPVASVGPGQLSVQQSSPQHSYHGGGVTYRSLLGDPGMRARDSATALSVWNICDGAAQPAAFGHSPSSTRLADCWGRNGSHNQVTEGDNALAFGLDKSIPGFPPTSDAELFYRQKEVYLAKLCRATINNSTTALPSLFELDHFAGAFNYSGFEIEFKSGILNTAQGICPCSGTPRSCALWSKHKSGNMNQPLVSHKWSDPVSGEGYFAGTWDVEAEWTSVERQAVLHAIESHADAWVDFRQAELLHRVMPEPEPPALLVNKSFAFASWHHRNGSKVYYSGLQTSSTTPAIMNYFRINDVSGGYGGYPCESIESLIPQHIPRPTHTIAWLQLQELTL